MGASLSFRERNLTVIAISAIVGVVLAIVATFKVADLPLLAGSTYSARFAEAGGLRTGDPVEVAGVVVGKVKHLDLDGNTVRASFTVKGLSLGEKTRASIKTGSLLGARFVELQPEGGGRLRETIPESRTTSPYDLASELIGIAGHTRQLDLAEAAKAMQTFSAAIKPSTEDIGPAMRAVTDLSRTISSRDEAVRALFRRASQVTGTFRQRTQQITALMRDGEKLLEELLLRREVIANLIRNARSVADEVSGLVRDNSKDLRPALDQLNQVLDVLGKNQENIRVAVKRLSGFITPLGEGVASGPWFFGYIDLSPGVASVADPLHMPPLGGTQQNGSR